MVKEVIRSPRFIQQVKKIDGSMIDRVKKGLMDELLIGKKRVNFDKVLEGEK